MSVSDRYRRIAEGQDLDGIMRAAIVTRRRADLDVRAAHEPASNAAEAQMVSIWCEVLGLDDVGVGDVFFELGGDSLHMTQVLARVRHRFGRDVPIEAFFDGPTVRHLARIIAGPATPAAEDGDLTHMLDLVEHVSTSALRDDTGADASPVAKAPASTGPVSAGPISADSGRTS